jgi:hypothetical protein
MLFHSDHGGFVFLEVTMTKEQKDRYERPEQLRDILKRVLDGWDCKILCGQCGIYHLTRYGGDIMSDFDDDFDDGDYMDEDSFEDKILDDLDEDFTVDDSEPHDPDADEFNTRDAFFVGSIVGNAYEEWLEEKRRRELLRKKRTK